jgi:hypothetical protein
MNGVDLLAQVADHRPRLPIGGQLREQPNIILSSPEAKPSTSRATPTVLLEDLYLWRQFHGIGNEMIITRTGRCLFPTMRLRLFDLDPSALYTVSMRICAVSHNKFQFKGGIWIQRSTSHPLNSTKGLKASRVVHCHPAPRTGKALLEFNYSRPFNSFMGPIQFETLPPL